MRLALILILIAVAALFAGTGEEALAQTGSLRFDPVSRFVSPTASPFTLDIMVDNVTTINCHPQLPSQQCGAGGYTVQIDYDPTVVEVLSIVNGTFITSTGRLIYSCWNPVGHDPTNGVAKFTCATTGNPPTESTPLGALGSGFLARATVGVVGIGSTTLELGGSTLSDIAGNPICAPDYTPCVTADGSVTVNYLANLSLSKGGPSSVVAPGNVTYALQVTNLGPDQAPAATLVDTLPTQASFSSASPGCAYDGVTHTVTCDLGTMTASQVKNVAVTVSVAADDAGASLLNAADVTTSASDQESGNDHAEASTQVSASNVNITKTVPRDVALGAAGQYVIDISSTGPSVAAAVQVRDTLPTGVTYVNSSSTVGTCSYDGVLRKVTCNPGDMAPGASATVTIDVIFPNTTDPLLPHPDPNVPAATYVGNSASVNWTKTPPGSKSTPFGWTYVGLPDSDGDGSCHDFQELGSDFKKGGLRDPNNPYDFYDVLTPPIHSAGPAAAKDHYIGSVDLAALLFYALTKAGGPPNVGGADYDDDRNFNGIPDGEEYDFVGATGFGPDGAVGPTDVAQLLYQAFCSCVAP